MITEKNIKGELKKLSDSMNLIAKELKWILNKCNKHIPEPDTNLANELLGKFFSLYKDFLKLKSSICEMLTQLNQIKFKNKKLETYCKTYGFILFKKSNEGLFEQFSCVAETGDLPH